MSVAIDRHRSDDADEKMRLLRELTLVSELAIDTTRFVFFVFFFSVVS